MSKETNPEKWERIKQECERTGQDPYEVLRQLIEQEQRKMYEVTFVNAKGWRLTIGMNASTPFCQADVPIVEAEVNKNPSFKNDGPWTYHSHTKTR